MSLSAKIGPSILNADLSQLYDESQRLLDNGADYLVILRAKISNENTNKFPFVAFGCHGWPLCAESNVRTSNREVLEEQD